MRVGRFFGVPLFFAPSWLLVAALITITYSASSATRRRCSHASVLLLSRCFAIALAPVRARPRSRPHRGRLALGLPVRRIVIFLLGGVSEIRAKRRRPDEFAIALAGPLVSRPARGCWPACLLPDGHVGGRRAARAAGLEQPRVAVFNLLPGLPLDGGRLLRAAIWSVVVPG